MSDPLLKFLAVVTLSFTACSVPYEVYSGKYIRTDAALSYGELNQRISGPPVAVILRSGRQIEATDFYARSDSSVFVDAANGKRHVVATSEIKAVELISRPLAVLEGSIAGAVAGALIFGATAGMTNGLFSAWRTTGSASVDGAIVGGAVGAVIGHSRGHVDHYEFLQDSAGSVTFQGALNDTQAKLCRVADWKCVDRQVHHGRDEIRKTREVLSHGSHQVQDPPMNSTPTTSIHHRGDSR